MNKGEIKNKWVAKTGTNAKTMAGLKRAALEYLADRYMFNHRMRSKHRSTDIDWHIWRDAQFERRAQRIMAANNLIDKHTAEIWSDDLTVAEAERATGYNVRITQFMGDLPRAEWVVTEWWDHHGKWSYLRNDWAIHITVTVAGAQESIRTGKLVLDVVDGVPVEVAIKKQPYHVEVISDTSTISNRIVRRIYSGVPRCVTVITNEMLDAEHPDFKYWFSRLGSNNKEVCKGIIDTIGIEKLVQALGLTPIDRDGDCELYHLDVPYWMSTYVLKMRDRMEFVPPPYKSLGINTCNEALAWRNNVTYDPFEKAMRVINDYWF